MRWPWQNEPDPKPEELPWERYDFEPQPDITTHELALITRWLLDAAGPLYIEKDRTKLPEFEALQRHFRKVKP